uniref:Reverse transcriptase domain-containing protein n=1 Tax=Tanacetum cinerariifolium TaxID=118510 RepID=A0A699VC13_TANCI|nr:hypothetical protein [Tanacetum cinerariifolium]
MEQDFKPAVYHQRRVNPKIHDVIKQEVLKLLDVGLIYPISDSPWVSQYNVYPKRVVLQLLKMRRIVNSNSFGQGLACLHRLLYFYIPIDLKDQEKTTFTCPYGTFATTACFLGYAMHRTHFRGA